MMRSPSSALFRAGLVAMAVACLAPAAKADVLPFSYTFTGFEASGPDRLNRDGVASDASNPPKAFPGTASNNPTYFFTYSFTAVAGTDVIVNVTSQVTTDSFLSIYSGNSFNQLSLSTNYLGDQGYGGNNFSIVAPGGSLILVLNTVGAFSGQTITGTVEYTPSVLAIPEPSVMTLAAVGAVPFGLVTWVRRRRASVAA